MALDNPVKKLITFFERGVRDKFLKNIKPNPKTQVQSNKMQRNNTNYNSNKPLCKICFDAGKPESEYMSHRVRKTADPNSEIVCPVLRATECRYCHGLGHTLSRCPIREANNRRRDEEARHWEAEEARRQEEIRRQEDARRQEVEAMLLAQKNNKYAIFDEEEEVEEEAPVKVVVEAFPSLCSRPVTKPASVLSFSTACKTAPAPKHVYAAAAIAYQQPTPHYEEEEEEEEPVVSDNDDDGEDKYRKSVLARYVSTDADLDW